MTKCNMCGHLLEDHNEFEEGKLGGWKCQKCECILGKGRGIKGKEFYGG